MFAPALVIAGARLGVPPGQALPTWYLGTGVVVAVAGVLALPWAVWRLQGLLRSHVAYGNLQFGLRGRLGSLYAIAALATLLASGLLVPAFAAVWMVAATGPWPLDALDAQWPHASWAIGLLGVVVWLKLLPWPYAVSRTQNLLWTQTGNSQIRFKSELRCRALVALTCKNALLLLVTAGLYWPFARVAMARLRLEAISLVTRTEVDDLVLHARSGQAGSRMVSSLFSMDVGW
jgi:uncharacterized membrane protein YjgN (DUF898 family)